MNSRRIFTVLLFSLFFILSSTVSGNNVTFSGQEGQKTGTLNGQTLTVTGIGTFTKQ